MEIIKTELNDCFIIEPDVFGDHRGYFMQTHSEKDLIDNGLKYHFVQGNESFTKEKGTIRGLHFQIDPMCQAKLVRVTNGAVYDVVVDLRTDSSTYKKWIKVELSNENKRQLLVPRGFAHGFVTLTKDVVFSYMVDNFYSKEHDGGIIYNDSELNVDWEIENPIMSQKDERLPRLREIDNQFRRNR